MARLVLDKFVDCAVASNAKYIVTEDSHYNVLKSIGFPNVEIIKLDEIIQMI
jgi:predicted nucleic acid-binding protein